MRSSNLVLLTLLCLFGLKTQTGAVHSSPVVNPSAIEKPSKPQKKSKRKSKKVKKGKKLGFFQLLKLRRQMKKAARAAKKGKKTGLANASITTGLLSWIFGFLGSFFLASSWLLITLMFGVAAIILGSIALRKIRKDPEKYGGKVKAIFGVVLGGILIFLLILFFIIIINSSN